jgi:hypothetical protein
MFDVIIKNRILDVPIIKFTVIGDMSIEDMKKMIGLVLQFLEKKKPFSFYADVKKMNMPPKEATSVLLSFMRENKQLFKEYLVCSSVLLNDSATGIILKNLFNGIFKIQPPSAPNRIFTDLSKLEEWISKKIDESTHLKESRALETY